MYNSWRHANGMNVCIHKLVLCGAFIYYTYIYNINNLVKFAKATHSLCKAQRATRHAAAATRNRCTHIYYADNQKRQRDRQAKRYTLSLGASAASERETLDDQTTRGQDSCVVVCGWVVDGSGEVSHTTR